MLPRIRSGLLVGIALLHAGCGEETDGSITGIVGRRPLEGPISFTIRDMYAPLKGSTGVGEPRVGISMRTEKDYPCSNYEIQATVRRSSSEARFRLYDVGLGPICLTSLGPATRADFLDWTPGRYALVIQNNDGSDVYDVAVTDSTILIVPQAGGFTSATDDTVWRVPRSSMAIRCDTPVGADSLCDQLVAAVLGSVPLREFWFPAAGLAPYGRTTVFYGTQITVRCFRYDEADAFERAVAAATTWLATRPPDSVARISISLANWNNARAFPGTAPIDGRERKAARREPSGPRWYAREDSNLRHPAPEAGALSS